MQIQKTNSNNFNKNDDIDFVITKNDMIVNGNIVNVDGYQFEIDREKLEITHNFGKGKAFIINTSYIGTTSFTIKVTSVANEENIETYMYIVDENEEKISTNKEYTIDSLEENTKHSAKVIVKYKNGNTIQSNILNIQLEPRTYLYNSGKISDISGNFVIGGYVGSSSYSLTKFDNFMRLYEPSNNKAVFMRTSNTIDCSKYKKLCIEIVNPNNLTDRRHAFISTLSNYNGVDDIVGNLGVAKRMQGLEKIGVLDISSINRDDVYLYIRQTHSGSIDISKIWLEK